MDNYFNKYLKYKKKYLSIAGSNDLYNSIMKATATLKEATENGNQDEINKATEELQKLQALQKKQIQEAQVNETLQININLKNSYEKIMQEMKELNNEKIKIQQKLSNTHLLAGFIPLNIFNNKIEKLTVKLEQIISQIKEMETKLNRLIKEFDVVNFNLRTSSPRAFSL